MVYLLLAILGYLLGNVQFAVILSRIIHKDDVRRHGSGNAGSTNMLRVYGLKSGLLTFVCDFSKGVLAVILGRVIAGELGAYVCALFVVVGHDFPVFLKFKGGKGVASTFAVIWMLYPLFGAIITVYAVVMILVTRIISITSITGITLYLLLVAIFDWGNTASVILAAILLVLILIKHRENITRLLKGEESKISFRSSKRELK